MNLFLQFGTCTLLACLALPVLSGQQAASAQMRQSNSADVSSNSDLGPGDQLTINVADLDEVTNRTVQIASDGTLDLPLIGVVQAGGMPVQTLRTVLAVKFAKYVTGPQVSLQVTSSRNRSVSIIGEVNTPSVQELTGPLTLLAAISRAGGIRQDAGPQVIVTREQRWGTIPVSNAAVNQTGGFSRATFPLDDLLAEKRPEDNILLKPGDVVSIPKGSLIYVIGDVHRSGGFPLRSTGSLSVIEALALAEGLGPNAKSGNAKILRLTTQKGEKREEIPVDVGQVLAGKQTDPQLFSDDILFIPSSAAKSGMRRAAEAILQVSTGVLIYR